MFAAKQSALPSCATGPNAQADIESSWLVEHNVMTHVLTFYLPLHRFLAATVCSASALCPAVSLHELLPATLLPGALDGAPKKVCECIERPSPR